MARQEANRVGAAIHQFVDPVRDALDVGVVAVEARQVPVALNVEGGESQSLKHTRRFRR